MRSIILISTLYGLVVAAPRPQAIHIAAIRDLPSPPILGPALDARALPEVKKRDSFKERDACAAQPGGAGPIPGDGSADAYLASNSTLAQTAMSASTPQGYVKSFTNLQGSTQQIGYLTFKIIDSGDYDVASCAAFCDSEQFCLGFNIFYERDPSVEPADSCPNPPPITNVKCSLYGYPVAEGSATNTGQYYNNFHIVIAGSNGYSKLDPTRTPQSQTNFTGPHALPAAINAPLYNGQDTYDGMRLFNEGPFDPSLCAAACQAQTAYDKSHSVDSDGNYKACNFFNVYILTKNDVPQGTYCSFYTREWDDSYAVNTGYYYGSDVYKVEASFVYTLTNLDPGHV